MIQLNTHAHTHIKNYKIIQKVTYPPFTSPKCQHGVQ